MKSKMKLIANGFIKILHPLYGDDDCTSWEWTEILDESGTNSTKTDQKNWFYPSAAISAVIFGLLIKNFYRISNGCAKIAMAMNHIYWENITLMNKSFFIEKAKLENKK